MDSVTLVPTGFSNFGSLCARGLLPVVIYFKTGISLIGKMEQIKTGS